ncbi:MAG: LysM peptidoglycan-binding domain-containing protein [Anaerolineaceae bacterium]|nr:LysM peptidoglycan-binding domain-containing protein [Anaerolineaceae bacterium]
MIKALASRLTTLLLMLIALMLGIIITRMTMAPLPAQQAETMTATPTEAGATSTPSETIPPYTPLATLTPSRTLLPPPTFEPPTNTVEPSLTPSTTPTPTSEIFVSIPGLRGAESPTPSSTPGCEPRKDWKLTYQVQPNDALARIAERYNTTVNELVEGNCLTDANVIYINQELRVPGDTQPQEPEVECVAWEPLTPANGTFAVETTGTLTFNWRGPLAPRNLIRVIKPNGEIVEFVIEYRQNETVTNIVETFPEEGTYTWYVYPLNQYFQQVSCLEGGPWTFTKQLSPTITPTSAGAGGLP